MNNKYLVVYGAGTPGADGVYKPQLDNQWRHRDGGFILDGNGTEFQIRQESTGAVLYSHASLDGTPLTMVGYTIVNGEAPAPAVGEFDTIATTLFEQVENTAACMYTLKDTFKTALKKKGAEIADDEPFYRYPDYIKDLGGGGYDLNEDIDSLNTELQNVNGKSASPADIEEIDDVDSEIDSINAELFNIIGE